MSSIADRPAANMGPDKRPPVLGRYHDTDFWRFGSPPARYEQEMGGAIHELRACGICLLEPREFIGKPTIAWSEHGIPPGIRHESTMKQVQTTQIVDVETAGEIIQQFDRCKLVKAKCNMSAVAEVDFATVPDVILFQLADFFDRVDKGRWSAANRTNSRNEISRRDAYDLF